jgi:hypothetical protein
MHIMSVSNYSDCTFALGANSPVILAATNAAGRSPMIFPDLFPIEGPKLLDA